MCGEKQASRYLPATLLGSPPRVRGKAGYLAIKRMDEGITPAYAGKSSTATRAARSTGDHPRICGEKQKSSGAGLRKWGSPPRMRGKGPAQHRATGCSGITPAYAGKSLTIQKMTTRSRDHPRVCGEKAPCRVKGGSPLGSPPRMRGKDCGHRYFLPPYGITPAYAGKRRRVPSPRCTRRDHPRVCGEKTPQLVVLGPASGSPPRMRGKDWRLSYVDERERITPAYAGKSRCAYKCARSARDHPRVCGEKLMGRTSTMGV